MKNCLHMWEKVAQNSLGKIENETFWCPVCGSVKRIYTCQNQGKSKKCEALAIKEVKSA